MVRKHKKAICLQKTDSVKSVHLLLILMYFALLLSCTGSSKKDNLALPETVILDIANELTPKVMLEQESNLKRINNLLKLIEDNGTQIEYKVSTAGPNNPATYTEPKSHYSYPIDFDYSRVIFLFCNDQDSLQYPKVGKVYGSKDFRDYNFSTTGTNSMNRVKWAIELNDENSVKEAIISLINRRNIESKTNINIDELKYEVMNAVGEFISHINNYDKIVFIHLTSYLMPTFGNVNTELDYFNFYGGQMNCQAVVGDIETGKVIKKIEFKNANIEDVNFYYTKKEGRPVQNQNAQVSSMVKSVHDNLMNTMTWRLEELLAKQGMVPKKQEKN